MHFLQSNFNGGLFTPLMIGRPDVASYKTGCVTLQNFIVRPYGGVFKTPGLQYLSEVKTSSARTRLIPFRISPTENYVLELGNLYMRFYRHEAGLATYTGQYSVLTNPTTSTAFTSTEAWPIGYVVSHSGTGNVYLRTSGNTSLPGTFNAADWTLQTAGAPVEYPTPWLTAELQDIQFQQIGREIIFVHPNHPPYILESPAFWSRHYSAAVTSDFETELRWKNATWGVSDKTRAWMRFQPLKFTFPALTDSPAVGEGRNVTLNINLTAWVTATAYVIGDLRKDNGIAFYCTVAHTSGATTEPGVGASWATKWRVATAIEYDMTLSASDAQAFLKVVAGDDFVIEPPVTGRSVALQLSSTGSQLGPTSATFIQGAFVVRSEWPSAAAVTGTVTLEQSFDNSRWESAREWTLPTVNAGTISFSSEAPSQGAWYRLKATLTAPGVAASTKQVFIEPVASMMKLALKVRSVTSSTVLVVDSGLPFGGTPPPEAMGIAATSFYLAAFCSQNGYPGAIAFHNLRLWLGGTDKEPNRLRSSAVNDFLNFGTGSEDDDGFDITLGSNESCVVKWIASYRQGLVVGTGAEEWTVQGGDGTEVLKPSNVQAIRRSRSGSKSLMPVQTRDALLWVSATARKLFEFAYVFTSDKYEAPDMTLRAEHVTLGGIQEMAFQSAPDPILWCVTGNGKLIGFSYNRQDEITAWFERTTDGTFESVCTIGGNSGADQVWVIVKRTINGSTKRYIERLYPTAQAFDFTTANDFMFVDCGKITGPYTSPTGAPTSDPAIYALNFSYLEGKTVTVLCDGVRIETHTVASGSFILDAPATFICVGLPITSTVQSMPLEVPLQDGTAQGRNWRPNRVDFILDNSLGGKYADTPSGTFYDIEYPTGTTAPYTGRRKQHVGANWEETVQFVVKHSDPTPFNMLGYVLVAEVDGA